uniref:ShKT domain-containing protein n=1 Tax=Steinernema glaseri TaxID=37863 RepID=A0A1I7YC44_9BILA
MASGKKIVFALFALLALAAIVSAQEDGNTPKEDEKTPPKEDDKTPPKEDDKTPPKEDEKTPDENGKTPTEDEKAPSDGGKTNEDDVGTTSKAICSDNGTLLPSAIACEDKAPTAICGKVFKKVGKDDESRDQNCFAPQYKNMAKDCAKTCGTCCLEPAYACKNHEGTDCDNLTGYCSYTDAATKQMMTTLCPATCGYCQEVANSGSSSNCKDNPEFNCAIMTQFCNDYQFQDKMTKNCPVTCGRCDAQADSGTSGSTGSTSACKDIAPNCGDLYAYCNHADMPYVKQKCPRTCGVCVAPSSNAAACTDTSTSCASWQKKHGYCQMDFYPLEHKKTNCRKTCNLCNL